MPGPYKWPEGSPQRNVGGGVPDTPQVNSPSRVICRAASPLAAVAVCGNGRCPGRDESLPYKSTAKRSTAVSCGPGMPGPYKWPEGSPQRNVGGGVPDTPQVNSPSRVICRAASPLAAVAVCGNGRCPGRDESLPYKSTAKRSTAVSCGPGMPGPYKWPEGSPQRNVGGGVPDAPHASSPSRVMRRAASPLAAAAVCGSGKIPERDESLPYELTVKGIWPEGLRQRNVGGGVPDAPQVSSPSRVMRRAASPLAAVAVCGSKKAPREG